MNRFTYEVQQNLFIPNEVTIFLNKDMLEGLPRWADKSIEKTSKVKRWNGINYELDFRKDKWLEFLSEMKNNLLNDEHNK